MLFNLDFANHTNFIMLLFLFIYLIPRAIGQIFNRIAELVILIGKPRKEAKAEIEIHPIIVEAKIRKCSV